MTTRSSPVLNKRVRVYGSSSISETVVVNWPYPNFRQSISFNSQASGQWAITDGSRTRQNQLAYIAAPATVAEMAIIIRIVLSRANAVGNVGDPNAGDLLSLVDDNDTVLATWRVTRATAITNGLSIDVDDFEEVTEGGLDTSKAHFSIEGQTSQVSRMASVDKTVWGRVTARGSAGGLVSLGLVDDDSPGTATTEEIEVMVRYDPDIAVAGSVTDDLGRTYDVFSTSTDESRRYMVIQGSRQVTRLPS